MAQLLDTDSASEMIIEAKCKDYLDSLGDKSSSAYQEMKQKLIDSGKDMIKSKLDMCNQLYEQAQGSVEALTSSIGDTVEIVANTTTSGTALSALSGGAGVGMITAAVSQVSSITNSVKGIASAAISICNQLVDILTLFNNGINLAILSTAISTVNAIIELLKTFA